MRLQPNMNAVTAGQHAEANTHPGAANLVPEEAGKMFLAEEPPSEVGAPR